MGILKKCTNPASLAIVKALSLGHRSGEEAGDGGDEETDLHFRIASVGPGGFVERKLLRMEPEGQGTDSELGMGKMCAFICLDVYRCLGTQTDLASSFSPEFRISEGKGPQIPIF